MNRAFMKCLKLRKFTLVELLVVIAVLGILVSLLQPTLSGFYEKGRLALCSSNLRTQGVAHYLYVEDYRAFSHRHAWVRGAYDSNPNYSLKTSLSWPYIQDEQVYICPTFRMINDRLPERKLVTAFSYGMNWYVSTGTLKPNDFKSPSQMALTTEENPYIITGLYRYSFNDGGIWLGSSIPYIDGIATFHLAGSYKELRPIDGFANVLFVDGHVGIGSIDHAVELLNGLPTGQ